MLSRVSFASSVAWTPRRLWKRSSRESADLVISDLTMPGMSGIDLLERVRLEHPGTEFVLLTANATVESAIGALRMGAADYLIKPVQPENLALIVERILSQRRSARRERAASRYPRHGRVVPNADAMPRPDRALRRRPRPRCCTRCGGSAGSPSFAGGRFRSPTASRSAASTRATRGGCATCWWARSP